MKRVMVATAALAVLSTGLVHADASQMNPTASSASSNLNCTPCNPTALLGCAPSGMPCTPCNPCAAMNPCAAANLCNPCQVNN